MIFLFSLPLIQIVTHIDYYNTFEDVIIKPNVVTFKDHIISLSLKCTV